MCFHREERWMRRSKEERQEDLTYLFDEEPEKDETPVAENEPEPVEERETVVAR